MNPIESVEEWIEGVGHQYHTELYASLVLEEAKEMLEALECPSLSVELRRAIGVLDGASFSIRKEPIDLEISLGYLFAWLIRLLGLIFVLLGQSFIEVTFRISKWMDDFRRHHRGRF